MIFLVNAVLHPGAPCVGEGKVVLFLNAVSVPRAH